MDAAAVQGGQTLDCHSHNRHRTPMDRGRLWSTPNTTHHARRNTAETISHHIHTVDKFRSPDL